MAGELRALVAEDDADLASLLARALTGRGWTVETVPRGDAAMRRAENTAYDAILLDVMLPGLNGFEVCRRMRSIGIGSSIIMLTARGAVDDRVEGLAAGADDYLVKPFALRELHARLDAVQRRRSPASWNGDVAGDGSATAEPGEPNAEELVVGRLVLTPSTLSARVGGATVELRPKECAVLAELMRRTGHYVSRYDLLESCWDGDVDQRSNVVETTIRRLRSKLRDLDTGAAIETVRGAGYRITGRGS